jgi:hypothetical protein
MNAPTLEAANGHLSPAFLTPVVLSHETRPQLCVVVDTEEEFDWSAPLSRDAVSVTAIDEVDRLQAVLEPHGVKPTYVIDYPVAATPAAASRLAAVARRGACDIGAHLHPWVNPPHVETVSARASYACNLGEELERRKVGILKDTIEARLGVPARSYKAGRYGFGRTSASALEELGFDVDLSVSPHLDHTHDGGPSFEGFLPVPAFFGHRRRLLEVPCTVGFTGAARRVGPGLHRLASAAWLAPLRAVGVLARGGVLNKIMLSPENSTFKEMRAVTEALHRDGLRVFSLTFHSPSLKPGCTPYVRTAQDRQALLDAIDRYCAFFLGPLGGVATTPAALFDTLVDPTHAGRRVSAGDGSTHGGRSFSSRAAKQRS